MLMEISCKKSGTVKGFNGQERLGNNFFENSTQTWEKKQFVWMEFYFIVLKK
jgi:hypothetical protein